MCVCVWMVSVCVCVVCVCLCYFFRAAVRSQQLAGWSLLFLDSKADHVISNLNSGLDISTRQDVTGLLEMYQRARWALYDNSPLQQQLMIPRHHERRQIDKYWLLSRLELILGVGEFDLSTYSKDVVQPNDICQWPYQTQTGCHHHSYFVNKNSLRSSRTKQTCKSTMRD